MRQTKGKDKRCCQMLSGEGLDRASNQNTLKGNICWMWPPPRIPVTTRIITFLVGNPYKPSFTTFTVRGPHPKHMAIWFVFTRCWAFHMGTCMYMAHKATWKLQQQGYFDIGLRSCMTCFEPFHFGFLYRCYDFLRLLHHLQNSKNWRYLYTFFHALLCVSPNI